MPESRQCQPLLAESIAFSREVAKVTAFISDWHVSWVLAGRRGPRAVSAAVEPHLGGVDEHVAVGARALRRLGAQHHLRAVAAGLAGLSGGTGLALFTLRALLPSLSLFPGLALLPGIALLPVRFSRADVRMFPARRQPSAPRT